jgi:hypothetical protein
MTTAHLVIVTGGRDYPYPRIVHSNLNALYVKHGRFILFHGACRDRLTGEMTGADQYADDWAQTVHDIEVKAFDADWDQHGSAAGPIRNHGMVIEAVNTVPRERIHGLAFPSPRSRGTWNCVKLMKDYGIEPDVWRTTRARTWLNSL